MLPQKNNSWEKMIDLKHIFEDLRSVWFNTFVTNKIFWNRLMIDDRLPNKSIERRNNVCKRELWSEIFVNLKIILKRVN